VRALLRLLRWLGAGAAAGMLAARVRDRQERPLRARDVAAGALGGWLAGYLLGRKDGLDYREPGR
jgi:uncharacterized membrane protein YeaQ/YmgE (transglycosylase-associated protein family)